ncbi:MAG: RDD family protein [Nocardioidaceae bacterium]
MSDPQNGAATYATLTADDLVTGEAVALDLPPASVTHRVVSGLIDLVVTFVLFFAVVLIAFAATISTDEALMRIGMVGTLVTVFLVYPTAFETLTRGRSLGKLAMGLRTVRDDAGPISFQHAFVRSLIGIVEIYPTLGGPAFISSMLSARGKRLGDYAAGTYVVRDRVSLRLNPPPLMPPRLAGWAASADIAALPNGLALAVRSFLGRAWQIDPATRQDLGVRLADEVSRYVAPLPPPGTPPDAFLAAVIAARRDRDSARLQRENALRLRLTSRR